MRASPIPWTLAGESVLLDADRALAWPGTGMAFVADLHLGKDQLFRESGLATPGGTLAGDLLRLSRIVDRHDVRRLVVLGDLVHARTLATAEWIREFGDWLAVRPALELLLVAGNHDRWLPTWPALRRIEEGASLGPFVLRHAPCTSPFGHVLAGHLHPGAVLRERHAPPIRLPAFWCGPQRTVLPAFGRLTGLSPGVAEADDRVLACAGPHLVEVSAPQRRSRASQSRAIRASEGSVAGSVASSRMQRQASASDSADTRNSSEPAARTTKRTS